MSFEETLKSFSSSLGPEVFHARKISETEARKAFALVQLFWPDIKLVQWLSLVSACCHASGIESGWVAIEDIRSYIHAIFYCRMRPVRNLGRVLRVSDLIVADLPGSEILRTTVDCARHLAFRTQAKALELELDEDQLELVVAEIEDQAESGGWSFDERPILRYQPIWH